MARKGARRPYCQKVAAGDAVHSGWTVVTLPSYTRLHTCAYTWLHTRVATRYLLVPRAGEGGGVGREVCLGEGGGVAARVLALRPALPAVTLLTCRVTRENKVGKYFPALPRMFARRVVLQSNCADNPL